MEHVAIMKKSFGFTEKIIGGRKKVESRWYRTRRKPWGVIRAGDTVYFKDSGEPVTVCAEASKIIQYSNLSPKKIREILKIFGKKIGIEPEESREFFDNLKHNKYCVLIVLKNPRKVKPFEIKKEGFGAMAAWLSVPTVKKIRK
jgi:ASC-1-like (ASCH) protein